MRKHLPFFVLALFMIAQSSLFAGSNIQMSTIDQTIKTVSEIGSRVGT